VFSSCNVRGQVLLLLLLLLLLLGVKAMSASDECFSWGAVNVTAERAAAAELKFSSVDSCCSC
jgi:hypothetical protein